MTTPYKKKLIEVAIPLEAINAASAREKSIRHGHPSTLHLWWARRPLAACRAVLFAQLVDDPSSQPDQFPTHEDQERERQRLFAIIEDLVKWENSTNEEVLERARAEIRRSCGGVLPPVYDPFSGGGSIPLEAQRLGLPAYGSDLNPVAVMIGKAMIEIPPKFKDMPPIHPGIKERSFYRNADGLTEDVKYYGEWMREKAWKRIGHLYPKVDLPKEYGGGTATVIAWIWARTVPSPDPAFADVEVPIASSFVLCSQKGKETWIEPVVDRISRTISYNVRRSGTKDDLENASKGTKAGRGANFRCVISGTAITPEYVKSQAASGKLSSVLTAIVAQGNRTRLYLEADDAQRMIALCPRADGAPELPISPDRRAFTPPDYGMPSFGDLFSNRQVTSLLTWIDLIDDVQNEIKRDLAASGSKVDAGIYANALAIYLAMTLSRVAMSANTLVRWNPVGQKAQHVFGRQVIPIVWDYAETNPFATTTGSFSAAYEMVENGLFTLGSGVGQINQSDAQTAILPSGSVVCTDPPYYDNVGYSDLADFFYCWLRPAMKTLMPELFSTIAGPKKDELIASPYRQGGRDAAELFFLDGMKRAISNVAAQSAAEYPAAIFYAFKQSEIEENGITSAGWATFIQAVIDAGFAIVGTWPMRTEMATRMRASGSNALANSVVLVCRRRETTAEVITRAEFIRALKRELPPAIAELQSANIAPADMPQSAIGPGMGVFSRYKAVLEADDSPMAVKTALQLINAELDEFLGGIQGEFDAETRFAITWFEQHGMERGDYGSADNLARARGISVESVKHAGLVESSAGRVRLLKRDELDEAWNPSADDHLTVWECLQHLVRLHERDGVSIDTARMLKAVGDKAEAAKDLAYCLYDLSANKRKDAKEATAYNALIADWADLSREAQAVPDAAAPQQIRMEF